MYQKYKDKAAFFLVYIREAHPDSVLHTIVGGEKRLIKIGQTETAGERKDVASKCVETLKLSMPTLIDREDNRVNYDYAGWPERLYVIGMDGKIAYQGGPGPREFKVPEVVQWLERNTK